MSRTVAALYDTRAEAESARARLLAEFGATEPRIIAKDTAGAIDGLHFDKADTDRYHESVRRGSHLLVAHLPGNVPLRPVIGLLEAAIDSSDDGQDEPPVEVQQSFRVADEGDTPTAYAVTAGDQINVEPPADDPQASPAEVSDAAVQPPPEEVVAGAAPPAEPLVTATAPDVGKEPVTAPSAGELRVGAPVIAGGGGRVRAVIQEMPTEEQVSLRDEVVEIEQRPSERRLSDAEVEAGGLFCDRVIEVAEMREEPVVTKSAVVREEVIIRKTVHERTETIRDTVRHTEVELGHSAQERTQFAGRVRR